MCVRISSVCILHFVVHLSVDRGFPCGSDGKESACNAGDLDSIPGLGRSPGEGKPPTPVFWPREFHGLYSQWDHKESDMTQVTEHTHTHTNTHVHIFPFSVFCLDFLPI